MFKNNVLFCVNLAMSTSVFRLGCILSSNLPQFQRDFTVLKKEDLDAYDDAIREALEVMGLEEPMKKARQDA